MSGVSCLCYITMLECVVRFVLRIILRCPLRNKLVMCADCPFGRLRNICGGFVDIEGVFVLCYAMMPKCVVLL